MAAAITGSSLVVFEGGLQKFEMENEPIHFTDPDL